MRPLDSDSFIRCKGAGMHAFVRAFPPCHYIASPDLLIGVRSGFRCRPFNGTGKARGKPPAVARRVTKAVNSNCEGILIHLLYIWTGHE
jgi:hypothetical protein